MSALDFNSFFKTAFGKTENADFRPFDYQRRLTQMLRRKK
jgi:hypothetical protein